MTALGLSTLAWRRVGGSAAPLGAVVLPAILLACGGNEPTGSDGPTEPPGIQVLGASPLTGRVAAATGQPLVVRVVAPNGRPAAGVSVRFWAPQDQTSGETIATFARIGFFAFEPDVTVTTDADGQVTVQVLCGTVAGSHAIAIEVPKLHFDDSAILHVEPGPTVRIDLQPLDTAAYIGTTFPLRAATYDDFRNRTADQVVYEVLSGSARIADSHITLTDFGEIQLRAEVAGVTADTSIIRAVPRGTITAYERSSVIDLKRALVALNLDGSGRRRLATAVHTSQSARMPSDWSPDGSTIVFADYHGFFPTTEYQLYLVDAAGGVPRLLIQNSPLASAYWPRYSRDGRWIYFGGQMYGDYGKLWRVRPDGSGLEQIGPAGLFNDIDTFPSPSPDGTYLAYGSSRGNESGLDLTLRILTIATGQSVPLTLPAATPAWSPNGDWIAYVVERPPHQIRMVKPDGSGDHAVTAAHLLYVGGISWSPDGRFLVALLANLPSTPYPLRLHVIEAATGKMVALPFTMGLEAPAWR